MAKFWVHQSKYSPFPPVICHTWRFYHGDWCILQPKNTEKCPAEQLCLPVFPPRTSYFVPAPLCLLYFPPNPHTVWTITNQTRQFVILLIDKCKWAPRSLSGGPSTAVGSIRKHLTAVCLWASTLILGLELKTPSWRLSGWGRKLKALCFEGRTYRLCFGNGVASSLFTFKKQMI